ncbi:MAG TPA: hypothetical protein VHO72_08570 [Bacteroidales bacterium]|nr:hypothetical protein [Bacteroidales bacterium]
MRILLFLFTLVLIANTSIAQNDDALNSFNEDVKAAKRGDAVSIAGSPYGEETSSTGVFYMKDNKMVDKTTRLNYFHSNFEYEDNDKIYLADAVNIDSVVFNKAAYVYRSFAIDGTSKLRIVKVIGREGSNAVYFYKEILFKPAVKAGGYIEPKPARYESGEEFFLFESGDKLVILNNFKGLISLFPGKEGNIKKFIKDSGISKNKPEELKKLLHFVSQL